MTRRKPRRTRRARLATDRAVRPKELTPAEREREQIMIQNFIDAVNKNKDISVMEGFPDPTEPRFICSLADHTTGPDDFWP